MSVRNILMAAAGAQPSLSVADVFSAYPYIGTGSTKTINNGIDLAGNGGAVWLKARSATESNILVDTARGKDYILQTNTNNAQSNYGAYVMQEFLSDGFRLGSQYFVNQSATNFVSWTFRKAEKFFDVVTYTGNGGSQAISHSLGVTPGMIVIKKTSASGDNWVVWHKSLSVNNALLLNSTLAAFGVSSGTFSSVGSSSFSVGAPSSQSVNENGATYVAYVFAHDDSAGGVIQCGSVTTAADGTASITLGWQPQYLLWKSATNAVAWQVADTARGWVGGGNNNNLLAPNSTATEATGNGAPGTPTETGINFVAGASQTLIYMAIRAA